MALTWPAASCILDKLVEWTKFPGLSHADCVSNGWTGHLSEFENFVNRL
ncbi:hypothetical protein AFE_3009 [Acidithiobacillus ferrooxidans ATCC 23270]|uniref:Uncharacterized protein n=1 Tax=Acidithiobacillus ferrooxidans (strain ATCC 23270 / DSM 14882 / CIP 104768 / NCIMB 8455) TaxID=243159 RepID=B7J9Y2_ACIF2|nr:hypothetical protein AFE_3009 [Acidithiobacillus ferrooxidans ATCC 23270]